MSELQVKAVNWIKGLRVVIAQHQFNEDKTRSEVSYQLSLLDAIQK